MSEPLVSQELFAPNQYYTMDMLKEMLPFLGDIGYYILYNRINEPFITEEEKLQNIKIIERLKTSRDLRIKPDLKKLEENLENIKIEE
jgi:hypothetical protein